MLKEESPSGPTLSVVEEYKIDVGDAVVKLPEEIEEVASGKEGVAGGDTSESDNICSKQEVDECLSYS